MFLCCSLARRFATVAGGVGGCGHRLLCVPAGDFCDHAFGIVPLKAASGLAFINCFAQLRSIADPYGARLDQVENRQFPERDVLHGCVLNFSRGHRGLYQGAEHGEIEPDRRGQRDRVAENFLSLK
jgi:hypothetical protein